MWIHRRPTRLVVLACAASVVAACGAGSRTPAETAEEVACDYDEPPEQTEVNVLAYNSSAIDPFTNTMVKSCTKGDVTLNHEPIDFAGQVQKTTATLAGDSGTYDIIESYGFVVPELASKGKLAPLDDMLDEHGDEYALDELSPAMREAMSYEDKLYALPMQAQMYVLAYRKDIFEDLGLQPPKTFAELAEAAKTIQQESDIEYPLALPLLADADIVTAYDAALGSLGTDLTDPETMTANLDSPESEKAIEELLALKPYMDPEVTTFDQPAVQQQMYNGSAAMSIMFSGRMNDLTLEENSQYADDFAFAPPPSVDGGSTLYNVLSVDGWSIPTNAASDEDMLFEMIASSVGPESSKASLPAAYPAREGMVDDGSSPFAAAANESIEHAPPAEPYPWTSQVSIAITPILGEIMLGKLSVEEGMQQMQDEADEILAEYR